MHKFIYAWIIISQAVLGQVCVSLHPNILATRSSVRKSGRGMEHEQEQHINPNSVPVTEIEEKLGESGVVLLCYRRSLLTLLENCDSLGPCRQALVKIGLSSALKELEGQDFRAGKMFVATELAWETIIELRMRQVLGEHQYIGPRHVAVSLQYLRLVHETITQGAPCNNYVSHFEYILPGEDPGSR